MEMLTECLSWAILLLCTETNSINFLPYNVWQKSPLFLKTAGQCRVTDTVWNKVKWRLSTAGSLHFAHCYFPKDTNCAGWAAPRNRHICCSGPEACQIPAAQRLSWWILFLAAALVSAECHVPTWQWELVHTAKKRVLGPGSAVGFLGKGSLRNTDQMITAPPFVAPALEIQTTTSSFIWNDWPILIQGLVRRLSHAPKLRSQTAL